MQKLILAISVLIGASIAMPIAINNYVYADTKEEICKGIDATGVNCSKPKKGDPTAKDSVNTLIANIINILSWIVGVLAVIFVIWGGFKYITSGGDSSKVGSAKNTIIYALIGLVIVALAQTIVIFVLDSV